MDVLGAFSDTLTAIRNSDAGYLDDNPDDPCSLMHIADMMRRLLTEEFSDGKRNRWLGYLQGVAVARGILSLDECKEINRRRATGATDG